MCSSTIPTLSDIPSESLLADLIANITVTTFPKILNIFNISLSAEDIKTAFPKFTEEPINSTELYNETIYTFIFNVSDLSVTPNATFLNPESEKELALNNWLTIKEGFRDYLSYVLSKFDSDPFEESSNFSYTTDVSTTQIEQILNQTTTFEYFKTTMAPFLETTWVDVDERFEQELSTIYDEVTTTISSSFPLNITSEENCDIVCDFENATIDPTTAPTKSSNDILDNKSLMLDYSNRSRLRSLCWETMFGQELVKLTVMDLLFTVASSLSMEFFRGIFVRVMNRCWCWDLEKTFPQYADFKVAENILHLVNNQGNVWMGMFFSPGLALLNVIKLYVLMYVRSWTVLTCNVPHEVIFRASRSNNFYFALLLMMLFLGVLPVGYAIVWVEPSWHCGPFSNYRRIFHIFTKTLKKLMPKTTHRALDYIASPGIVIPILVLLILIIYYLVSLTNALREANNDLKVSYLEEKYFFLLCFFLDTIT